MDTRRDKGSRTRSHNLRKEATLSAKSKPKGRHNVVNSGKKKDKMALSRVLRQSNRQIKSSPISNEMKSKHKNSESPSVTSPEIYSFEECEEENLSLSMDLSPAKALRNRDSSKKKKAEVKTPASGLSKTGQGNKCARGIKTYIDNMKRNGTKKTKTFNNAEIGKASDNKDTKTRKCISSAKDRLHARHKGLRMNLNHRKIKMDMAPTSTPSVLVRSRFKNADVRADSDSNGLVDSPMLSPVERIPDSEMCGKISSSSYNDCLSEMDLGSPKLKNKANTRSSSQQNDHDIPEKTLDIHAMKFEDDCDLSITDEGYLTLQRSGQTYSSDGSKLASPAEAIAITQAKKSSKRKRTKSTPMERQPACPSLTRRTERKRGKSSPKTTSVPKPAPSEQDDKIIKMNEEFDSINDMEFYIE